MARETAAHGHYLAGEAGLLAGVSGDRIGQWARWGYIRSSHSDGEPRVYSYEDVAEAMVWMASRPAHVCIDEMVIKPTDQAAIHRVHRRPA